MGLRRSHKYLIVALGLAASLWLAGLLAFVGGIGEFPEPALNPSLASADAIVVLTGGSERVATGLALLKAGKGKKLLISGVHHGLTLDHMLGMQSLPESLRGCCVVLGHAAESTMGNAAETRDWMRSEDYHTLRLVTANYHMPRSLLVFHAMMPDVTLMPHPVTPDSVRLDGWWTRPGTASLLVTEYDKYILACLRLRIGTI